MKKDRFELEYLITRCWGITDDIGEIMAVIEESKMEAVEQDKILNMLIGVQEIYNNRFSRTINLFNQLVRNGTIDDSNRVDYDGIV